MTEYSKPLPLITELSRVFYDGCREGKLLYQRCKDCDEVVFFPKRLCSNCMGRNLEWKASKGKGRIHTFTVTYESAPPEFAADCPYALAIINLAEGFSMLANIVDCELEKITCDMPVEVVFRPVTSEITLPQFRPKEKRDRS